ncbi:bifunctional proline dehydrogenase/L-glutamate gamma-semialdehyde dehydrogenase [Rhodoplanes elegans]|uniref:Bifunctional protein PutA n=1 Tax=Rhodoplanes elegans TaxID=29408 RepID=A0A327KK90_9BRAD|nr:bifunctional proline dehydrogenase/L-glutamate gamma-semialdehyde dehydrogenase PutA [Rhodoplanes elegans]MBK5960906.1 bifunctional proline dehydrogenase/L-glutamate gamma-semialdehyde dehydrogenase [Rhodoplanes elegans]RAI35718.1 bifunctional proline dehydrogenase/L-glutamate gamma-semialdehyde dehydrogenase [Rhodoplanes elegans]
MTTQEAAVPTSHPPSGPGPFRAPLAPPDEPIAERILAGAHFDPAAEARIEARATRLVEAVRTRPSGIGGIDDLLREYALSTREGLALMVLAEALLRVPDDATADRLIEDRLRAADFVHHAGRSGTLVGSVAATALGLSARVVASEETPHGLVAPLVARLGRPAVRAAVRQAIRLLGTHFVFAETIGEAVHRAERQPRLRWSFDMLGEGARTAADAERYAASYAAALAAMGGRSGPTAARDANRPSLSVKLSALHPRYEAVSRDRVTAELGPRLRDLACAARAHGIGITIDAEEADRLELSLDLYERLLAEPDLAGWGGLGLAVQAYQKRAGAVIAWLVDLARARGTHIPVRLVKGAYWDTEIKRAQERGLADYPVFTRKAMTDLAYLDGARALLAARPHLSPQFATHNALTIASVIEIAGGTEGYEFQRLHGMGEALYERLLADEPAAACRVYAPVGVHRDLLAYLVRRLLENGANSSFVSQAADPAVPLATVLKRPSEIIGSAAQARNPRLPRPCDIHPGRRAGEGIELGHAESLAAVVAASRLPDARDAPPLVAAPLVDGVALPGHVRDVVSPIDGAVVGRVTEADAAIVTAAMAAAAAGFAGWDATALQTRAAALLRAADLIEEDRGPLIALLQAEGGKTLDDALAELREAVDLCRYYALEARRTLSPEPLPGPTGESNVLRRRGRGVVACISPWNFPLAIFTGQVAAALVAGNAVVAKPAEQTPLVAAHAVRLLHAAGIPLTALHLLPGDGDVGALMVADARLAGVAFTGSTAVARSIAQDLAARDGPLVPLIAETGGINAMIADATALPEQLVDDVITSAFRSAGQRCSALRLLCVQEDVAEPVITMLVGAAKELAIGDPRSPATHVGPVIDADAQDRLLAWLDRAEEQGRVLWRADEDRPLPDRGTFVPPAVIALDRASDLREEVFGPVLHVVRWRADGFDDLLEDIARNGTRLTLGIHSRIGATAERAIARLGHGNVYVNRNMIGAVVGTQPFGGSGLSGTGPKAGGPDYVRRFAVEQTVTINTAAIGGNAALLADTEE